MLRKDELLSVILFLTVSNLEFHIFSVERSKRVWRYAVKAIIGIENRTYKKSYKMYAVVLNQKWKGFDDFI